MSTGAVTPFYPNQPTQAIVVSGTSAAISFQPCDSVLLYNSGTAVAFVAFAASNQSAPTATVPTSSTPGSMPVPAGALVLVGAPGVAGVSAEEITQLAAIGTSGTLYATPGLGTQR